MNTSTAIKSIAFTIAAGYPCVAFAKFFGAQVPSYINLENTVSVFSATLVVLMLITDYTRRAKVLTPVAPVTPVACTNPRTCESHRLAA